MNTQIVVGVSHADPLVSAGLQTALRRHADFDLADDRPDAARRSGSPQVVVADYAAGLALTTGSRTSRFANGTRSAVLVVTQRQKEWEIRHALEAGVRGYLPLGCSMDELGAAVRSLAGGLRHIGAEAARLLADNMAREPLSPREEQVLGLVVEGLCNKVIARELDVGVGTVKSHLRSIFGKLDVASRTEAVKVAERVGLRWAASPS